MNSYARLTQWEGKPRDGLIFQNLGGESQFESRIFVGEWVNAFNGDKIEMKR